MKTKLDRFKVYNFRSIEESDWIEVSDNSCLVGTNEAGKTNLLVALWKLNPANNEPIIPLDDFPRHLYSKYKADRYSETVFIKADFLLNDSIQNEILEELNCDKDQVSKVLVKRKYNGEYNIIFPYSKVESYSSERLYDLFDIFEVYLYNSDDFIKESKELQEDIKNFLNELKESFPKDLFKKPIIVNLKTSIEDFIKNNFGRKVNLPGIFNNQLINMLQKMIEAFDGIPIQTTPEVEQKVLKEIPKFVYYSDYGNLDSEIYLPRVIEDFERKDLSESARAKSRTLDVLFKFVKLSPTEIYELGNESKTIVKKVNHSNQVISTEEQDISE